MNWKFELEEYIKQGEPEKFGIVMGAVKNLRKAKPGKLRLAYRQLMD